MKEKLKIAELNNRKILDLRPFPTETLKSLKDYYRVGLTYSSNAIEGNSLTESETKIVIEDGLTIEGKPIHDAYEAIGHAEAYNYIYEISAGRALSEEDILTLHRLFYFRIDPDRAGHYRKVPVFISGSRYSVTPPARIPAEMKKFISWYNKSEQKLHPVEFAALVHKKFVFIHPFIDGNGRLARLLMNLSLLRNEYTITIIPAVLRNEYIYSLEVAHKDDERFREFIADRVITTQTELLRLLKESGSLNKTDGGVNVNYGGVNVAYGGVNTKAGNSRGGVNPIEGEVIELLQKTPGLNAPAIAQMTGKSLRTIQRYIKKLTDQNKIVFKGAPKSGGYYPC